METFPGANGAEYCRADPTSAAGLSLESTVQRQHTALTDHLGARSRARHT
jgi:hypothetical protein